MEEQEEVVNITLDKDSSRVVFEYLSRQFEDGEDLMKLGPGEAGAFNLLQGALVSTIDEIFSSNYGELVEAAKRRIYERWGL